jgi:hypothetical protein
MIKDFVPARTSLASGVVIKQTLLERNKYPQPQTNINSTIAYASSGSQNNIPLVFQDISVSGTVAPQWNDYQPGTIENFSGGTGGSFEPFNGVNTSPYGPNGTGPENIFNITQSWTEGVVTPLGIAPTVHSSQDEFYNGEFSGSILTVTTQSLAQSYPLDISSLVYNVSGSSILYNPQNQFPPIGRINWQGSTYISSSYVSYLYINETSLDGVNISTALSNLGSGDTITFTVSGSVDDGPFQGQPFEATTEGTITSVTQPTPSVWRINLSTDPNLLATVYNIQYPDQFVLYSELYPSSSVYLDPFINDLSNFYNSDYNPLINNILVDRLSAKFQDVDYSTGITTPTNFGVIITGSAVKAAIQDSNYSSKRVILPRYEGSKSTSQQLNKFTLGDTGTYGKLPTVESLKTMVAYCDDIGGWPPERENASAAFVKYLIKSDGTVVIPNTTPNSLADNQETFETGENVLVQFTGTGNQATPIRKIIRGGTRIEPIIYTQYGQNPASWNTTMSFSTDFITSTAVGNYVAKSAPSTDNSVISDGIYSGINMNNNISLGAQASAWTNNYYTVNQDIIDENVTLTAGGKIQVGILKGALGSQYHYVTIRLIRERGGIKTALTSSTKLANLSSYDSLLDTWGSNDIAYKYPIFELSAQLSPQDLLSGDRIYYDAIHTTSTYGIAGNPSTSTIYINKNTSYLDISQSPAQTNTTVYSTGVNTLWGYPNNTKLYPSNKLAST